MAATRRASHAGSWYSNDRRTLSRQLAGWLAAAASASATEAPVVAKAVIAPHAGYSYSGPTAAFAYAHVPPSGVERVFVLGPSHHVALDGCALTKAAVLATPVGDLAVDTAIVRELAATVRSKRRGT